METVFVCFPLLNRPCRRETERVLVYLLPHAHAVRYGAVKYGDPPAQLGVSTGTSVMVVLQYPSRPKWVIRQLLHRVERCQVVSLATAHHNGDETKLASAPYFKKKEINREHGSLQIGYGSFMRYLRFRSSYPHQIFEARYHFVTYWWLLTTTARHTTLDIENREVAVPDIEITVPWHIRDRAEAGIAFRPGTPTFR